MKFTFKTDKSTGRYRSFHPDFHYIKFKKKQIGQITDSNPHRIKLTVVKKDIMDDGNPNCEWMWITLKATFPTVSKAKEWLNTNIDSIFNKYNIHSLEV